jgi:TetR/AcrR family transcriptional repressor of nem operon
MTRPAVVSRERLVSVAMQLFAEQGYGATSVGEILRGAEANAGSFYHLFPGKQDLLLAVLTAYHKGIGRMLLEPAWTGVTDPLEKIFALLDAYRRALVASDFFYGCPIGSLALELHEPDPPVRRLIELNFAAWRRAVASCLAAAGFDKDARRSLSALVLAVMEGAVMQARTQRSLEPFDAAVDGLRDYLTLSRRAPRRRRAGNKPRAMTKGRRA